MRDEQLWGSADFLKYFVCSNCNQVDNILYKLLLASMLLDMVAYYLLGLGTVTTVKFLII